MSHVKVGDLQNIRTRVLVIENDPERALRYEKELVRAGYQVDRLEVLDSDFDSFIKEDDYWSVVIMDSVFNGKSTLDLVPLLRKKFGESLQIIANSDSREENEKLKNASCNLRSTNGKFRSFVLPERVKGLLRLAQSKRSAPVS